MVLVAEAQANNIHTHLGFPSWTAYLADALDGQWRIERDKRGEVVRFLADQGMSSRAIAKITGIGKGTVYRELAGAPLGQVITGLDGKTYPRPQLKPSDEEWLADQLAELEANGRTFTIPATPEAADEQLEQLDADMRRLERIRLTLAEPMDTDEIAAKLAELEAMSPGMAAVVVNAALNAAKTGGI
jgi:hypothetical protein